MAAAFPLVLLTNSIDPQQAELLGRHADVRVASASDPDTLRREARKASFVVVRAPLPAALFDEALLLRAVVRHGAGLDMIPVDVASRAGVAVANVPGANAGSVAEYVLAQMLALARRLPQVDVALRAEGWNTAREVADSGADLAGETVTVVGMGAIGQALARICGAGFGMQVIGVRRHPPAGELPPYLRYLPLADALPQTDYLVLACPLTPETRGLIGADALSRIKPGARLVNVARGPVVVEAALVDALRRGRLSGAALDVFDTQPLPADSPLRSLPQVLLSPHLAGITPESMRRMSEGAVAQVLEMLQGKLPRHFVNPEAQEAILARWSILQAA
ncbi:NAD(P)-dependent oxidoreductase [Variovorax paradoxus]|uniref:NAD(P)-dependent oxidoreductase n=1 Tax=Variovorax paradoxus TaxID=34073 RepID=UPI0027865EAA|nr:NAD(P)-dependent oxidoreductase [Variovorax paradoxus]MDQ0588302.1 D-3-phosphoglycerate dehydrogenase [Variovorax paradoxus]